MKKFFNKDRTLYFIITLIILAPIIVFGSVLLIDHGIHGFRNQIRFLDSSWMCSTKMGDDVVLLTDPNHRKLISYLDRCNGKISNTNPEIIESLELTFVKGEEKWVMTIGLTEEDSMKLDLVGAEKEYHVYFPEAEYFDNICQVCSPEGDGAANKVLGGMK